jgi:hypothetical protein
MNAQIHIKYLTSLAKICELLSALGVVIVN